MHGTDVPTTSTSEATAKEDNGNHVSGGGKTKERDIQVVYPTTTESTASADAYAAQEGTCASLFTAAEPTAQLLTPKRRRTARKHRNRSVTGKRPSEKALVPTSGQALAVGA
jgi:hypothetical protein